MPGQEVVATFAPMRRLLPPRARASKWLDDICLEPTAVKETFVPRVRHIHHHQCVYGTVWYSTPHPVVINFFPRSTRKWKERSRRDTLSRARWTGLSLSLCVVRIKWGRVGKRRRRVTRLGAGAHEWSGGVTEKEQFLWWSLYIYTIYSRSTLLPLSLARGTFYKMRLMLNDTIV